MSDLGSGLPVTMRRPERLYKYRSLSLDSHGPGPSPREVTTRIVRDSKIYFARREQFNDPFEGYAPVVFTGTEAERRRATERLAAEYRPGLSGKAVKRLVEERIREEPSGEAFTREMWDVLRTHAGIVSLTARNDDLLMWGHYGDSHRGVCIGFDSSTKDYFGAAEPVRYQRGLPVIDFYRDTPSRHLEASSLTKSDQWNYEEEWRYVGPSSGEEDFPGELLVEIVLGCAISSEDRDFIVNLAAQRGNDVALFQATMDSEEYALRIDPLR